jgi:sulfane dehydrogenase subunit SoxC
MGSTGHSRRQLLKGGAALAGLALAGVRSASAAQPATGTMPDPGLYDPNFTEKFWEEKSAHPEGRRSPLSEQLGILTPNRVTFTTNHRNLTPNINAREHTLLVHGLVDRPMTFTMEDLRRLPSVSRVHYVACAGQSYLGLGARKNPGKTVDQTHGGAFCSDWTGVLLSTVLDMVGVQKGANWMVAESVDVKKHAMDIPVAKGMDDAILAYGQNGDLINPEQGYPLRLIVPGFEGTRNVKWLGRIKVTDRPYWTYYENSAYLNLKTDGKARNFQYEMEPGGVITFPSGAQQLPGPGFYEIRGLAWSGGGAVHRVEISADGGRTWKDSRLNGPVHRKAFTMFTLPWKWDGQEAVLLSRTTDDTGDIQPSLAELTKIWRVTPDYWQTSTNWIQHYNAIQPWRIDREGMVTNGMFHPSNNT